MTGASTIGAELSPVFEEALIQIDEIVGVGLSKLLKSGLTLLLNSQDINEIPLQQRVLRDGDTVSLIPPVSGGVESGGGNGEYRGG